jgi:hypothetical protein
MSGQSRPEWLNEPNAVKQVISLLNKSGAPLELRAHARANEFVRRNKTEDTHITAERVVYGSEADQPLREIDLVTTIYEEFAASPTVGIQLIFDVLVECKFRTQAQVFGFPLPSGTETNASFVLSSDVVGSQIAERIRRSDYAWFAPDTLSVGIVEFKNDVHPQKVSEEDLVFKAGASLYDYVVSHFRDDPRSLDASPHPLVEASVADFTTYLREKHYAWWSVLKDWMRKNIPDETALAYSEWLTSGKRLYTGIHAFLPVLCVDSPIFSSAIDAKGDPTSFDMKDYLVTRLRVPAWPHRGKGRAITVTGEVPLIVTNIDGLPSVLERSLGWFRDVKSILGQQPKETTMRAWFEAAFYQRVRALHDDDSPAFQSTTDIEQYL